MTDHIDEWMKEHLGETREVPHALVQKAKDLVPGKRSGSVRCPHCGEAITPFKKPPSSDWNLLWAVAGALAFGLSFVFPDYFYQCLTVTALCGVKWIVERRAKKTQILVYKALSEGEGTGQGGLHRHTSRL